MMIDAFFQPEIFSIFSYFSMKYVVGTSNEYLQHKFSQKIKKIKKNIYLG